jgi:hypothetical protein
MIVIYAGCFGCERSILNPLDGCASVVFAWMSADVGTLILVRMRPYLRAIGEAFAQFWATSDVR